MFDPYMRLLGIEGEVPAPGQARVWTTLRPEHCNSYGSAHGGFLYTLADAAFALASNSHGALAVALSTHMEYLAATAAGERLEAVASEVHLGRRVGVYRVDIRSAGRLVGTFTGTVHRRPNEPTTLTGAVPA
jgi:acyl-CoA thioesterase